MSEYRYSELKYEGETYSEQWKIDEILIKNKFNWMVNAEIKNARLEIFQDTLVWNAGIWYNGTWYFGVWRDGEWRYGTWQNGVWYNGTWRNGTFKSGIIYKGNFFKGKIEGGEIRGGQFIDCEIDPKVVEYTDDEYQVKKEAEQKQVQAQQVQATAPAQTQVDPNRVVFHSSTPAAQQPVAQPKVQKESYNMKKIKTFESFKVNEIAFSDINWVVFLPALFILYKSVKNLLHGQKTFFKKPSYEQKALNNVMVIIRIALREKVTIEYTDDVFFHIFKFNDPKNHSLFKDFVIKINKNTKMMWWVIKDGEFTQFPFKLSDKQYTEFMEKLNKGKNNKK